MGAGELSEGGAAFVRRLRHKRDAILFALERFEPQPRCGERTCRVVSAEEIAQSVHRIRGRSAQPARDIALFYMLFATGARPLEIARLELRDYLNADGSVCRELRADAPITGNPRPVFFAGNKADDALSTYLHVRAECGRGLGNPSSSVSRH